jgi:quercetin dioxygenase-like cupin family protein
MKTTDQVTRRFAIKQATVVGAASLAIACRGVPDQPPADTPSSGPGFRVPANEARNDARFTMHGVTSNTLDLKIGGEDTGQRLAMFMQKGESPNGGPPLHIHPEQDEFFFVLEGDYQFQVGDQRFQGGPGDTIFMPRDVPHGFIQLSESALMMVAYQPAGQMEAFFRGTAAWTSPPTKEEVAAMFAAHGMKVVGPPIARV